MTTLLDGADAHTAVEDDFLFATQAVHVPLFTDCVAEKGFSATGRRRLRREAERARAMTEAILTSHIQLYVR
jgi:hypothetical protein